MTLPAQKATKNACLIALFICCVFPSKKAAAWKRRDSWEELAKRAGTDKVTTHRYEKVYEMWLAPWRHEAVNFLEIGLGCNMVYGPGKSLGLWENYFTHRDARVSFLEVDGGCVQQHNITLRNGTIFVGSQDDAAILKKIAVEGHAFGGYDVIVDDGGHTMNQQITSLKELWPAVSSGGIYVIEDLLTSYWPDSGGGPRGKPGTAIEYVKGLLDHLNCEFSGINCEEMHLEFVYCVAEACVLGKKNLLGNESAAHAHAAVLAQGKRLDEVEKGKAIFLDFEANGHRLCATRTSSTKRNCAAITRLGGKNHS